MYFKEEVVDFKTERRSQKINIRENKKFITRFNNLLDTILSSSKDNVNNQTFIIENENSIFYFRKINMNGTFYYSLQKKNKNIDYQFEYFYGDAIVNTTSGAKKIKEFNVTKDTINTLCFDLSELFNSNEKVQNILKELSMN